MKLLTILTFSLVANISLLVNVTLEEGIHKKKYKLQRDNSLLHINGS